VEKPDLLLKKRLQLKMKISASLGSVGSLVCLTVSDARVSTFQGMIWRDGNSFLRQSSFSPAASRIWVDFNFASSSPGTGIFKWRQQRVE